MSRAGCMTWTAVLIASALGVASCGGDDDARCEELLAILVPPGIDEADNLEEYQELAKAWQDEHAKDFAEFEEKGCEMPPD